jgi:multiple sugar transport system permease protein
MRNLRTVSRYKLAQVPRRLVTYAILVGWGVMSLLPLYWMIVTAFSSSKGLFVVPPRWFPRPVVPTNFQRLWSFPHVWRWLVNSMLVTSVVTVSNVFFSVMAGYALAKKEFPGRSLIFWSVVSMLMIPSLVTLVPLYILIIDLHMPNTYWALILPASIEAFSIFLCKQFIQTLPSELIDAAKIDGASEFQVFYRVVLPLSAPAVGVTGIFTFMWVWNDFFWPLVATSSIDMRTLQVGLTILQPERLTDYGLMMAGATFAAVPMFVIFFAFQRYFIKGITVGALKG